MKSKTHFREYNPDQQFLFPPDIKEWFPEDDLAYFVMDVVSGLDLGAIHDDYNGSSGGQPAYAPRMMVSLLLYGYCVGIPSSRKLERATCDSVSFRVLSANQHPDHDTIASFRQRHLSALSELFVQVLRLCQKAGLIKLGHIALDGTKVRASVSKHKAMSYGRMEKKVVALEAEVAQLLKRAESVDAQEDALYGKGRRGDEFPDELRYKESRLRKIKEAMSALKREAEDKAQARMDEKRNRKRRGRKPRKLSADSGYFSEENVIKLEDEGIDGYIATEKRKHGQKPLVAERGRIPGDTTVKERMSRKLRTIKGRCTYSKRKQVVEPVFGQIKHARGFRRFLFRGLEKVGDEWDLICLTHNLLKLFRSGFRPATAWKADRDALSRELSS